MVIENRTYFNIFKSDKNDLWYWHLVGGNGEVMTGSEGYTSKQHAVRAAEHFQSVTWNAEIRGAENEPEQKSGPRYEAGQEPIPPKQPNKSDQSDQSRQEQSGGHRPPQTNA